MKVSMAAILGGLLMGMPVSGESLHGRILDRGALSEPKAMALSGAKLVLYDTTGRRLGAKSANKAGAYRFQGLKPGRYVLSVERKDCLPVPLVRVVEIGRGDTSARDFGLDRAPRRNQAPAREAGKRKTAPHGYYSRMADGLLEGGSRPSLFREAQYPYSPGRFFDAEDTTEGYRRLFTALLWAEIESQDRPVEHCIFLAHALDSALKASGRPGLPALSAYLKVPVDSLEAYTARVRAFIAAPPGKKPPEGLRSPIIPKSLALKVIDGHLAAQGIPLARKRAFLSKAKGVLGVDAVKRLSAGLDAREKARKARKPKGKTAAPAFDSEALWKIVMEQAGGKKPNPVALYHVGYRQFETGRHPEALASLQKANAARPEYPRGLFAEARVQQALGDSALAEKLFEKLTTLESTEWQARGWHGLARAQWLTDRAEAAESSLMKSLGMDEKSDSAMAALMLLAEVSLERNTWSSVRPMLESLAMRRPREPEAQFWLGQMALKDRKDGEALERFRKARGLAPANPRYAVAEAEVHYAREQCGEALRVLKPLRARLGADGLSVHGKCLLALGRAREAASEFERMHSSKPSATSLALWATALNASGEAAKSARLLAESPFNSQPKIRMVRAETHMALGQVNEARDALEPMRARSPEDPQLHYLLARGAYLERNYAEASRELTEAVRHRQDYPEAIQLQGSCLLKLGRGGEARHYFEELANQKIKSWRARGLCGLGQAFAQEGKLEEAVVQLSKAFAENPSAEAAAHLALVHLRQEKVAEASSWADKARKLDPKEPLGLMAAVDVLLSQQRQEEAVALAASGLEQHPEDCDFQMVAAKVSLKAGKDEEARELSMKAVRSCPSEPAPHYYLGSLSARAGVTAEAKRHFGAYMAAGGDAKRVPAGYR